MARYIVEDSDEEFVTYDEELVTKAEVLRSVFRKIVGNYKILDAERDKKVWEDISQIV